MNLQTNRRCLREPVPEIFEAANLLRAAVDVHLKGDISSVAPMLEATNSPVVREWTESIWGKQCQEIRQVREVAGMTPLLQMTHRVPERMPNAAERASLLARDGYHCRFCGIPLVPKAVRQRIVLAYPSAATWGRTNETQHAALQAMWLQFDHILPHARGGTNDLENVVITCAPCNFGRMNYTLEEMGLADPRTRPSPASDWNGLVDFR